ncbi:hypothetical protein GA0115253_109301, partial [Streptomyces sp. Termitarium-T10T-6]
MPHLGIHALLLGVRHQVAVDGELGGDRGVAGLVGAGEVGPESGDPEVSGPFGVAGRADQFGPVGGLAAAPAEAGVGLELDAGRAAGGLGGGDDLAQRPHAAGRYVDVGLD